ncbi:flavin-containing monooxygenase FMO [Plenodomus tracheiphilus IPT5]|uniref:Flavin-containing monooxygenase FMO n=1 Tax=Plenodomus tracheiphilus IPT5 TaxID=1408161 RepID=A0A6A7AYC5_9PLEO|nr:flavin-containing monooxygenase FMO [Plenodomus tracheiphilus IPT5]
MAIKRVAVIGLGPGGAITIDALAREQAFDQIRVFERREAPGGCWIEDTSPPPNIDPAELSALATRKADRHIPPPPTLPTKTPKVTLPRYSESSVYPYLETNTPFRHHKIINRYINSLVHRNGYEKLVSYNTTVELAEKVGEEWRLVLRRPSNTVGEDEWWEERFDAIVVASGHYTVPYIPKIEGLEDFERARPGSVKHTKMFRGRDAYKGKRVVVVGASVSAADIAYDLIGLTNGPVYAVILGHKANGYFGDIAFKHPSIVPKPSISHITTTTTNNPTTSTVHFTDGTTAPNIDEIIFGTGYSWTLPFLPQVQVRNNRVPGLYQHVVYTQDPTLLFVGAVAAGLTFRVFEWQAVLAARILSGRAHLPPLEEQQRWEAERIAKKGDGVPFTLVFPDFEEYFEGVRELAGEEGPGRKLPRFDKGWVEAFMGGHEIRKAWWGEQNEKARRRLGEGGQARARL